MQVQVIDDRLIAGGRAVVFVPSPHVGGRFEPTGICVHDTGDRLKPNDSVAWFQNPASKVSAHLVVGRRGLLDTVQMAAFDVCAWHAGKSSWNGRANCNNYMIGIEIDNPGRLTRKGDRCYAWFGDSWPVSECIELDSPAHGGKGWWLPYTPEQIRDVMLICRALIDRYATITDIVGHFMIAPKRKVDVGPHYPLAELRTIVPNRTLPKPNVVRSAQEGLASLGYWPGTIDGLMGPRTRNAIRTFQEQHGLTLSGQLDAATLQVLSSPAAKPMPTASRETTTKKQLKAAGSTTMAQASMTKRATEGLAVLQLVNAIAKPDAPAVAPVVAAPSVDAAGGALDGLATAVQQGEQARDIGSRLSALGDWLLTPDGFGTAATLALCALVWFAANNIEWARLRDHVLGKNAGGSVT
jgi:N-acetyl-anhydromuramyl-L-alanine amidase AmpD